MNSLDVTANYSFLFLMVNVLGVLIGLGTLWWNLHRDRKKARIDEQNQQSTAIQTALEGFDMLVKDLREEIQRLREQRDEAEKVEEELRGEIASLRREIARLRTALKGHNIEVPPDKIIGEDN